MSVENDGDVAELLKSIDRNIKLLLRLRAVEKIQGLDTNSDKVLTLHRIGLDTGEIAEIIGTSPASVRAARSRLKKSGEIDE